MQRNLNILINETQIIKIPFGYIWYHQIGRIELKLELELLYKINYGIRIHFQFH